MAALAGILGIAGLGAQALGGQQAREISIEDAKTQAKIEGLKRESTKKQFDAQIKRQQPFLDVGTEALPKFMAAIANKGDASGLPATQIQGDMISEFLGDEAPQFIKDRALKNLTAVESERNKGRLADLVSAGLGGTLSAAGAGVDLGTQISQSLAREGNIRGESLQQGAINRQNIIGKSVQGLAGLPALIAAQRGPAKETPATVNEVGFGAGFGSGEQFRGFA